MRTVVIVDDSESERKILKGFLEADGVYEVVAEGVNGDEAVNICRTKRPDLLLMDVKMPGKGGIEAAEEISRTCPTPIVLLTASDDEETVKKAVEAGVMGYLLKPVRPEELAPAIELSLSRFLEIITLKKEKEDLKSALQSRKLVEKAKGLLMAREALTEDEAFSRLRRISMDRRKSMSEIAEVIILALEDKKKE